MVSIERGLEIDHTKRGGWAVAGCRGVWERVISVDWNEAELTGGG
jgi:hypothetical protein